ncbi:MAG TPA: hypothetical protein VG797_03065 [Phycisphaerales bacterium]|nr:hypothetical protein [Phycisphaerales bacterium]
MTTLPLLLATIENDGPLADSGPNPLALINSRLWNNIDVLNHPAALADILTRISVVWAAIFVLLGGLCLLNGYRWHKAVIVVLAALGGIWIGVALGQKLGNPVVIASCLSVLLAVVAWPGLKYAVAVFGGLAGAFLGANLWTALGFNPGMHQMGAVIGLVTIGMLTFLAFRAVVILLTVVGGATLLLFGGMAVLLSIGAFEDPIVGSMKSYPLMIPVIAASLAIVGAVVQYVGGWKGLKASADRVESGAEGGAKRRAA